MKWVLLFAMACGPSMPSEIPASSPASPNATAAPAPALATALEEDPSSRWAGLGDAGSPAEGHHHHAH